MRAHTILEVDNLSKEYSARKKGFEIRIIVQVFFFALILLTVVNRFFVENRMGISIPFVSNASLHSLCPFGGVVSIYTLVTKGTFVQKIHESSFVMLAIVLFLSVLFGPVFCGWICPLGSIQEWVGKMGRKMFKRRYNTFVPEKLDRGLRYLRYLVLAWVVYVTAMTSSGDAGDSDTARGARSLTVRRKALVQILLSAGRHLGIVQFPECVQTQKKRYSLRSVQIVRQSLPHEHSCL